jgi:hypothetical protein
LLGQSTDRNCGSLVILAGTGRRFSFWSRGSQERGFSLSAGVSDPLSEVDSPAASAVQTLGNFAPNRYLVGKPWIFYSNLAALR